MSGVNAAQVQERNAGFNKPLFDNTMISQDQKMGITNAADAYMKGQGGGRMQNNQLLKSLHELIYNSGLPQELKDQLAGMGSYQGRASKGGRMVANIQDQGVQQVDGQKPKPKRKPKGDGKALVDAGTGKPSVPAPKPKKKGKKEPAPVVEPEPAPKKKFEPRVGRKNTMMEY